jgi:hypothetical protein
VHQYSNRSQKHRITQTHLLSLAHRCLPENADDRKNQRRQMMDRWRSLKGREVEKRKQNTLIGIENKKSINTMDEI